MLGMHKELDKSNERSTGKARHGRSRVIYDSSRFPLARSISKCHLLLLEGVHSLQYHPDARNRSGLDMVLEGNIGVFSYYRLAHVACSKGISARVTVVKTSTWEWEIMFVRRDR